MGDRTKLAKLTAACIAMIACGALAAAATAQGPGDYEPTPTTPGTGTTTLPGPSDSQLAFRANATGAEKLGAFVKVNVYCDEFCSANAFGRLRFTRIKTGKGKDSASFKLGRASGAVTDGHELFKLKVPEKAQNLKFETKPQGGRIRGKVSVTAQDSAGNVGLERLRLNFRDVK